MFDSLYIIASTVCVWGVVFGPCFIMQYSVSFLGLQSSRQGRDSWLFTFMVYLLSRGCYWPVSLPLDSLGWSVVCDCSLPHGPLGWSVVCYWSVSLPQGPLGWSVVCYWSLSHPHGPLGWSVVCYWSVSHPHGPLGGSVVCYWSVSLPHGPLGRSVVVLCLFLVVLWVGL